MSKQQSVGELLAANLYAAGCREYQMVAGDYNLILADHLLAWRNKEGKGLKEFLSSNELNCGFSAGGSARSRSLACALVTYNVGAFSAFNSALGGSAAEGLPVLLVSGAPNSNDYGAGHVLHHTIGETNYNQQVEMSKHLTHGNSRTINVPSEANKFIAETIREIIRTQQPGFIEIACNTAGLPAKAFGGWDDATSNAIKEIVSRVEKSKKVVILIGQKVKRARAIKELTALADSLGCAVVETLPAMSVYPTDRSNWRGVYQGDCSVWGAEEVVKAADLILSIGPNINDYQSNGYTDMMDDQRVIAIHPDAVETFGSDATYFSGSDATPMKAVLDGVLKGLKGVKRADSATSTSLKAPHVPSSNPKDPLTIEEIRHQVEANLTKDTTIFAETGDTWFQVAMMKRPAGVEVISGMQYGHIGESVPAIVGAAEAQPERNHICMVGDGSFQLTFQELGQAVRYKLPILFFVVDNHCYGIEVAIHDGTYNYIPNWAYASLMKAANGDAEDLHEKAPNDFYGSRGHGAQAFRVTNGEELKAALKAWKENKEGPTLIQARISPESFSEELGRWGRHVAKNNSRAPVKR